LRKGKKGGKGGEKKIPENEREERKNVGGGKRKLGMVVRERVWGRKNKRGKVREKKNVKKKGPRVVR